MLVKIDRAAIAESAETEFRSIPRHAATHPQQQLAAGNTAAGPRKLSQYLKRDRQLLTSISLHRGERADGLCAPSNLPARLPCQSYSHKSLKAEIVDRQ